jgi:hypothetical protein
MESAAALMRPWTRASAADGERLDEVVADDDLQRRVDEQMRNCARECETHAMHRCDETAHDGTGASSMSSSGGRTNASGSWPDIAPSGLLDARKTTRRHLESTGEQKTVGRERGRLEDVERDGFHVKRRSRNVTVCKCESFLKNWTGVVTVNMSPVTTISSPASNTLTLMRWLVIESVLMTCDECEWMSVLRARSVKSVSELGRNSVSWRRTRRYRPRQPSRKVRTCMGRRDSALPRRAKRSDTEYQVQPLLEIQPSAVLPHERWPVGDARRELAVSDRLLV